MKCIGPNFLSESFNVNDETFKEIRKQGFECKLQSFYEIKKTIH
jgi:hypothetical protein